MGCMDIQTHHNLLCSSNMSSSKMDMSSSHSNGMYGHSDTSQSIVFVKYVSNGMYGHSDTSQMVKYVQSWTFRHITIYCVRQICHPVMGCMDIQTHHNLLCSSNMSSSNGMYGHSDTSQSIVFVKYVIQ